MARPIGRCVRAAGLLSLGVLAAPVSAAPVEYYISAGAYTDIYGGASGSGPVGPINGAFTYDAATGAISDVHIAVVDQVHRSGFELPADPAL
ncbi:hypothetical protein SAMN05444336_111104 [Albimonas donghaensis]|uniref:Uncharacterized protein n=1 Tax=Albimonas donghaensis TaxID=356660 RepID=A0A1H3F375_9RHOB|nr:hypothetical protein [Albimonas donghaensis]SDX85340.1 hypothetical protein SAMN05444336_111104 [Albimonas donghaensis]